MFWVGAKTLSEYLDCTEEEAAQFIWDFDLYFPGIIRYLRKMRNEASKTGFIQTAYGRKLFVPRDELYKAASYRVQGSAADLMKRVMVDIDNLFREWGIDAHIIMQIHDELIVEVNELDIDKKLLRKMKFIMESHERIFDFPIPVKFERAISSWSDTESVEWLNR
jgi:DNA polymerase-1